MNDRPRSVHETQQDLDVARDTLEALAEPIIDLGEEAARAKWAYRRGQAAAIEAGVTKGCTNERTRNVKIWAYQISPGVTVADLGEEADRAENAFRAQQSAIKAVSEAARISISTHVTSRESMP